MTTAFEASYPPLGIYLSLYLRPISLTFEAGSKPHPRMRTSPSLQWKSPGRGMPFLPAPNRKPSLLSKLILASAISSYLVTAFFTAFMFTWRDTKTVISSSNADTFAERWPARGIPRRARISFSSLSLRSKGSKARSQRVALLDKTLDHKILWTLPVHLHHYLWVVVHRANPFAEHQLKSGGFQSSRRRPMVDTIEGLVLIQIHQRDFLAVF